MVLTPVLSFLSSDPVSSCHHVDLLCGTSSLRSGLGSFFVPAADAKHFSQIFSI